MRVTCVEPERDAPARRVEHGVLRTHRPLARKRPVVGAQALGELIGVAFADHGAARRREVLAAPGAQVRLRCAQVVPVGLRLNPDPFHREGDEVAVDPQQLLDDALRRLVAPFAEVVVADEAVPVDEVERRPIVVVERRPHRVVVVERDRVVDPPLARRRAHAVDLVLEGELRRVDADHDQPVVPVGLRPPPHVRLRAQPVDARQGPEVHQDHVPGQLGGAERLGIDPPRRPTERMHVLVPEHRHLQDLTSFQEKKPLFND